MTVDEMHQTMVEWNRGRLDSYLIEITGDILGFKDADGSPLVEKILDAAGQKGTGKWTSDRGARPGDPAHHGHRGRARALAFRAQGRAGSRVEGAVGSEVSAQRRPAGIPRGSRGGRLRGQDHLLHPGLHAHAVGRRGVRVEPQLRRHRAHVARRLHHSLRLLGQDQGGLRQESGPARTSCSTPTSSSRSSPRRPPGAAWSPGRSNAASRYRPCRARSASSTAIGATGCRPIWSRHSVTTSGRTPTSASTSRGASSSTPTGPAAAAT